MPVVQTITTAQWHHLRRHERPAKRPEWEQRFEGNVGTPLQSVRNLRRKINAEGKRARGPSFA